MVTGAAGFIGSCVAKALLEQGNRVVTIDNLSTGYKENIPKGCEFIKGDVSDSTLINSLKNVLFEAILHIAGQSGGITSFDNPVYDLDSNAKSTLLLLDFCKKNNCKKFIYASSMSVYGDENVGIVRESDQIKPKTFYAVGKLASEHYMRIYSQQFKIKTTALRLNNVYGPGQNMKNLRQGMVSIFMAQAIDQKRIHVLGAKERFRDFVYIDDIVSAFLLAVEDNRDTLNSIFNVATGVKTTVAQLIETMLKYIPEHVRVIYQGSTPGDQFGIYCDYSLIQKEIEWQPKTMLDDGLKQMAQWALSNIKKEDE